MQKVVNNYLKNFLTEIGQYSLTSKEEKQVLRDKTDFIVKKLTRKKFRRRKLVDATKKAIADKVQLSLDEDRPIHLVIPFGGYKHFWNNSSPEPDWAELFNFRYLTDLVLPALTVHKPGVIIEYVSEDMILTRMNNYSQSALDQYAKVFLELITWFNKQTQDNLEFKFFRVGDRVNKTSLIEKIEKQLPDKFVEFDKLSNDEKERELHRSARSINWDGEKNLTGLSNDERHERVIESRLIELAYYDAEAEKSYLGEYLWEDNHVCVCFSFGTTHDNDEFQDLTIGSTYGSIVDHWIGRGILHKRGERIFPNIVSKTQYEKLEDKIEKIDIDLLPQKNFKQIEVLVEN